jgi:hypothetical protein
LEPSREGANFGIILAKIVAKPRFDSAKSSIKKEKTARLKTYLKNSKD